MPKLTPSVEAHNLELKIARRDIDRTALKQPHGSTIEYLDIQTL
jgi:hypothetical protein